jgi:DNA-binding response OmpR family regulator
MKKILIVSSDKGFLNEIKSDPHFWNFVVKTTDVTTNLFYDISAFGADLLIVDFILNDSNGGSVCHQLKSNPETRHLPVIMLSDYFGVNRLWSKFGCDIILQKPVSRYELLNNITDLFNASLPALRA